MAGATDAPPADAAAAPSLAAAAANTPETAQFLQTVFQRPATASLVESFQCKRLQTYRCPHNSCTPDIQMAFEGTLYVTDKHTCFQVEERGRKLPIKLPHKRATRVERLRLHRRGDGGDALKITTAPEEEATPPPTEEQYVAFKDFPQGGLDSALALLEHLTGS